MLKKLARVRDPKTGDLFLAPVHTRHREGA
jgi:hypothetical protein